MDPPCHLESRHKAEGNPPRVSHRDRWYKVIWHDGQAANLYMRRLERGRFLWPSPADGIVTITPAQMGYLLSGIDWRNPQETWRPTSIG